MILPLGKTMFPIMFIIFLVTSFGIDCWWVWAPILRPFWKPFRIAFHDFGWLVSCFDKNVILLNFDKNASKRHYTSPPFSLLCRSCFAGGVFKQILPHIDFLLVSFWSLLVPVWPHCSSIYCNLFHSRLRGTLADNRLQIHFSSLKNAEVESKCSYTQHVT